MPSWIWYASYYTNTRPPFDSASIMTSCVIVPKAEVDRQLFSWAKLGEGEDRKIKFSLKQWRMDCVTYLRNVRTYAFPGGSKVGPLLARFKEEIGWQENAGDTKKGRIGDVFWQAGWVGNYGYINSEIRLVFRNRVVALEKKVCYTFDHEKSPDDNVKVAVRVTKDLCHYDQLVHSTPKPENGPSMTYQLLEEEQDRKVRITYQHLASGAVQSEHSVEFEMQDPYSLAEVNQYMAQVLFYCTNIQPPC